MTSVVLFAAAVLALRLFYLQVVQYELYVSQSDDIRIKHEEIEAPRGFIFDREGEVLAENQLLYSVTVDPFMRDRLDETIPNLAGLVPSLPSLMGSPPDSLTEIVLNQTLDTSNPVRIIKDADFRLVSIIEEHRYDLPGVGVVFGQRRHYPYGPHAAHILGYTGEVNRDDLDRFKDKGYRSGNSIGKNGIERMYEDTLHGSNGAKFVEMNYLSRRLGITDEIKPIPPVTGENLRLTIDIRLQLVAEEAFGDSVLGSFVALDPRTGEVLVMASLPSFDPNEFTHVMTGERYASLITDPDKPLYNRAIQATYSPGSTFKPLTALAGLENGMTASQRFNPCNGGYYYGRVYHCWNHNGHGSLDMIGALENSCNVYFYQLNRRLTLDQWHNVGTELGFGGRSGIDLADESPGTLPNMDYYENTAEGFSPGKMLNLAIGQGEVLVTGLQLARYAGIIATEGMLTEPHLVQGMGDPPRRSTISMASFWVVREGMRLVVNGSHGTARSLAIPGVIIAAKTGTVQNPHGADHKVLIAFAPYDNPTIAVACIAENVGNYTSSLAIPIAKKVLTEYFRLYPPLPATTPVVAGSAAQTQAAVAARPNAPHEAASSVRPPMFNGLVEEP